MVEPKENATLIQNIDLILNRLSHFKQNLSSKLETYPLHAMNGNGTASTDTNIIKAILEENPDIKKERDSAKFFQITLIKFIDKIIEEYVQKSYQNKEIEKEIILLEDRLKEAQKNQEEIQKFNENLSRINSLEALERAKMLTMLGVMQALNERYQYLDVEKQKSFKAFAQDMIHTLDDVKKDNGKPLTLEEKTALNNELANAEIRLVEKYLQKEEHKAEGRNLNEFLSSMEGGGSANPGLFLPGFRQNKNNEDVFAKVMNNPEFKQAHMVKVKEILEKNGMKDPVQADFVTAKRIEVIKTNPNVKKVVEIDREQRVIVKQQEVVGNKILVEQKIDIRFSNIEDRQAAIGARRANKKI